MNEVTWWLTDDDLLNLRWARMRTFPDGTADVFDCDGRLYPFRSPAEASDFLSEDELTKLSSVDESELEAYVLELDDLLPPEGESDSELLPRMSVRMWGAELRRDIAATAFSAPWERLAAEERRSLQRALLTGLHSSHVLFGREVRVFGRRQHGGEVVCLVADPPELAIVDLSPSMRIADPLLPPTVLLASFDDFLNRMLRDEAAWKGGNTIGTVDARPPIAKRRR